MFSIVQSVERDQKVFHVFGLTGSGKSFFVAKKIETVKPESVFILDFEAGFKYLCRPGNRYFIPTSSETFYKALDIALKDNQCTTIVIDGCTTLWVMLQNQHARANQSGVVAVDIGQWGILKSKLESMLQRILASGKVTYLIQRAEFNEKSKAVAPQGTDIFQYLSGVSILASSAEGRYVTSTVKERKIK